MLAALAIKKENVSRRLTELRDAHRDPATDKPLSQEKAAARVGVTMRQWQRWEGGVSVPYPRNLEAIADEFGFQVSEFFDESDKPTPNLMGELDGDRLARIEERLAEAEVERQAIAELIDQQNANLARQTEILEDLKRERAATATTLERIEALVEALGAPAGTTLQDHLAQLVRETAAEVATSRRAGRS